MLKAYLELLQFVREASLLYSCATVLGWDEETYLPPGGVEHRANQLALLAVLHYEKAAHPRIGALLDELEASDLVSDPESGAAITIRQCRRDYNRLVRLPRTLVEELS